MKLIVSIKIIIVSMLTLSCVEKPIKPTDYSPNDFGSKSAYIICEGIWNYDNASISRINYDDDGVINDYFQKMNSGMRLGDLANDIVIHKNVAYIAVSTTKTIEAIDLDSGKSIGRIIFEGKLQPREIAIINDTIGFVTDLYDFAVYKFNPQNLSVAPVKIRVGPAPEGIANYGNYLFIANSGYGDILKDEPGAGTISVIDIQSGSEIQQFKTEDNVLEILINSETEKLYALYNKLASEKEDSLGGIIEFNINNFQITGHWRANALSMTFSQSEDTLLFINDDGVGIIDLLSEDRTIKQLIKNTNSQHHWYSLGVSPFDNSIWVGNAKNYQVLGEVLVFADNSYSSPREVYQVGINPAKIVFH